METQGACLTCGKELSGKRRKFCPGKCADRYKPNVCEDCGKPIGRKSIRCTRCAGVRNLPKRPKRKYYCQDCGVEVGWKAHRCKVCAPKRLWPTREEYHRVAREKGIEWLGPWIAAAKKTSWRCENEHAWDASLVSVRKARHNGCQKCNGLRRRHSPDDYHALAAIRNMKWIGTEVSSVNVFTYWECEFGHVFRSRYQSIGAGHGCPHCYKFYHHHWPRCGPTKSKEDYHQLATEKGISWIGKVLPLTMEKTFWECEFGHMIEVSYEKLREKKKPCRQCNFCTDCEILIPVGLKRCEKCKIEYCLCIDGCGKMMSAPGMICLSCRNKRDWQNDDYRAQMTGETAPRWAGGLSLSPYGSGWTTELKKGIRGRDNYTCAIDGEWGNHVHHINYDKADHRPENLITLCCSCHIKTNTNRQYWETLFPPIAVEREKQKGKLTQVRAPEFVKVSNTHVDKHTCAISYSLPVSGQSTQVPLSAPFLRNGIMVKKCPKCTWVKPYNKGFFKKRNQRLSHWCKECIAYYGGPVPAGEIDLNSILLPWSMHIDVTRKQANYIWN